MATFLHILNVRSHVSSFPYMSTNSIMGTSSLMTSSKSNYFQSHHIQIRWKLGFNIWMAPNIQSIAMAKEKPGTHPCEIYRLMNEIGIWPVSSHVCTGIHMWNYNCGNHTKEKKFWCSGNMFRKTDIFRGSQKGALRKLVWKFRSEANKERYLREGICGRKERKGF